MAYFNYHAKVQKLIKDGLLKSYYFVEKYKNIGKVIVLDFDYINLPIREQWFEYYLDLINMLYITELKNNIFFTRFIV